MGTDINIGYTALVDRYDLKVIPHYRSSYLAPKGRGYTEITNHHETHVYPKSYALANPDDPLAHLEFALKYEGVNLEIMGQFFRLIDPNAITHYIAEKPTGKYRRKIWFFYEFLLDRALDLPGASNCPYVPLLDPKSYYATQGTKSPRHAIVNNLLGNVVYCPIIRKTETLLSFEEKQLEKQASALLKGIDPAVLERTTNYLFTKETKSSFGIERIKPDRKKQERFITLLEQANNIPKLDKAQLVELQNAIVEEQYQDKDYRVTQNYVGELTSTYQEKIHYISPKPEDIQQLMAGYLAFENNAFTSDVNPVVLAAALAFGFVFLHPFEDGNGRIHRFLIHYVLSKTGFTPVDLIFPVSAVMLKNLKAYDRALETFSKPLLDTINQFELSDSGELTVHEDTAQHYAYLDYTYFTEYLFECIETTIKKDFKEELDFIQRYDKAKSQIQNILDMPDIKVDRIIRCIAQNNGKLGQKMRTTYFSELSDEMVQSIETVVRSTMLNRD